MESMIETVASGLLIPEGPVAMADGSLLFVEIARGRLARLTTDGRIETVAELGGGPNGTAIGPDGAVYVCNNGGGFLAETFEGEPRITHDLRRHEGGSIQVVDPRSGAFRTLYRTCGDRPLEGPNDIVFDDAGGFWFTDMGRPIDGGRLHGALYYGRADGAPLRRVRDGLFSPNGIALSPDGGTLYWSDTFTGRLWACGIEAPGVLADSGDLPGRVVKTLPGYQQLDSMAMEEGGRICVATIANGGITIFDPDGRSEHLPLDDAAVTNICFGGPDWRTAWITAAATGRIFRMPWPRPGLRLAFGG